MACSDADVPVMASTNIIYSNVPTTIFETMSQLANSCGAINLGQGFPDEDGPLTLRELAAKALLEGPNQYPPMTGLPELRKAVACHYERFHGVDLDWQSQTLVTSGATEALSDCINALINPGDEVVLFEPLYDCYAPLVKRAGGLVRVVRLEPPNWALPLDQLERAFTPKTALVLINNPLNPAGKVFRQEELEQIGELCAHYNAWCVADEVYEHLVFDPLKHISVLSLPVFRNRAVAIGSAGKTFSMTGWKIGYVAGAKHLLAPIMKAHQFTTFTSPPHLQKAIAAGLVMDDCYFDRLASDLAMRRDYLRNGLQVLGLPVGICEGTYFLNADFSSHFPDLSDRDICALLIKEAGVAAVPVSAFYIGDDPPRGFLRFCFCKQEPVLTEALSRLSLYLSSRG